VLRRRTATLARCFQLVTLSLGVPGAWAACSTTSGAPRGPDASSAADVGDIDGGDEVAGDEAAGDDTGLDSASDAGPDTSGAIDSGGCWATLDASDSGPDGEELCQISLPCGLENDGLTATAVGCNVVPMLPDGGPSSPEASTFPACTLREGHGCMNGTYTPNDAAVIFDCIGCPGGGGRRFAGFRTERVPSTTTVGAHFAEMAQLEAASVRAFAGLARELASFGAPDELVRACRDAARDERRHARTMTRLARKWGARLPKLRVRPAEPRSLAALARENAVEGCVRETFGALLNAWQASHAADPEVRDAMAIVAADELRHAALSWEIAAWAEGVLPESARRAIARAKRKAVARLAGAADRATSESLRRVAGLPSRVEALAMARGLAERLWAA
jgi:hypothetical protein